MANPRGQQRDKPFRDALRMEIADAGEDFKALRPIAAALILKASEGDIPAIKELADRLDGKVPQAIVGDDDHPSVMPFTEWLAWMKSPGATGPANSLPATTSEPSDSQKSLPTAEPEKP